MYNTSYKFESFRNKQFDALSSGDTISLLDASLYESEINEYGMKQEFDWLISSKHTIKAGFNYQNRTFRPRATTLSERDIDPNAQKIDAALLKKLNEKPNITGNEVNVFAEDLIVLGEV